MRAKKIILAVMAIGSSLSSNAQGAANLAEELLKTPYYLQDATFEVLLPSAADPVVYDVTLQSNVQAEPDSLAPCAYLIRWATESVSGPLDGFSAYYDGNHYRYRNNRLQEYHAEADIDPFMPLGPGSQYTNGVQSCAQFADLLPQYLGLKIGKMVSDSSFIYAFHADTLVNRHRSIVIDGVKRAAGYDQMQYSYVFDYDTHLPTLIDLITSPGAISEQLITVTYKDHTDKQPMEITEASLMEAYPDVFERYRESTFRAENLVNTPLPSFSCQILGESTRYTHHNDETFAAPLMIVMLDPNVSTTSETIAAIREAVDMSPRDIEVIWAFNDNESSRISDLLGNLRHGETVLVSANSLIRNCGITMFPTTLLVDRQSKVQDVVTGFNNDTGLVVLQKAMLLK